MLVERVPALGAVWPLSRFVRLCAITSFAPLTGWTCLSFERDTSYPDSLGSQITLAFSPVYDPSGTSGIRGLIRSADIPRYVPSHLYTIPLTPTPPRDLASWNQSTAFRHYNPSGQKYHVQHTLPTPTPPQIPRSNPPSNAHDKSLRYIKPAPATSSANSSVSPPPQTTASSCGGPPGGTQYQFVPYSHK